MTFSNYGRNILRAAVLACRDRAIDDAFIMHQGQENTQMGLEEHRYSVAFFIGRVVLSVSPAPGMTWGVWMAGLYFPSPIEPLFKPVGSPEILSGDSRAPS